jgi:hypothetical protein
MEGAHLATALACRRTHCLAAIDGEPAFQASEVVLEQATPGWVVSLSVLWDSRGLRLKSGTGMHTLPVGDVLVQPLQLADALHPRQKLLSAQRPG